MKVLQLITTLDFGGAPRGVLELMAALSARGGIQQQLIVLSENTQSYDSSDLPDPPPQYWNYRLRHSDWRGIQSVASRLQALLNHERVDILHTHLLDADLIGALACRGTRCHHLSHIRGTSEWLVSDHWRDRIRRWFYRRTFLKSQTRFVAVSQTAASHTQRGLGIPAERIRVVLNGIDPRRFERQVEVDQRSTGLHQHPNPSEPSVVPSQPFVIGSAGRFSPEKGYADLIEAVARLLPRYPQLRLTLAGQGGLQTELISLIEKRKLQGVVQLTPPVDDMNSFLRGLNLFVLPSHAEGLSRVLMEAMYCRVPVVAARVSGCEESIHDEQTGLLFEPRDIDGMALQIERMIASPDLRKQLGLTGGEFASENFTVARVAAQIEATYRELAHSSTETGGEAA